MVRNVCLLLLALILLAGSANAAMKPGSSAFFANLNYAIGKLAETSDNVDGGFVGLEYQKMDWTYPVSFGFSIGYGEINQDEEADSSRTSYSMSSVPVYLGGKYWFGEDKVQGFLGVAFGMYFSTLTLSVADKYEGGDEWSHNSETATNFGLGFPLGVSVSIGDTVMLTASYKLNWLWGNPFLDNNLLHAFGVGVGFSFGP
ncbi:MAG: outer membrane beta-barrel protein [Candidatus Latescibacterota bacterium]|nr:MAG: outer membrane beta-barrel protein [Candidatus Latescibacterota bacterium]